jgi:hypothetical protein
MTHPELKKGRKFISILAIKKTCIIAKTSFINPLQNTWKVEIIKRVTIDAADIYKFLISTNRKLIAYHFLKKLL